MKKQSKIKLAVSLILCLISIVFAGAIQTSWGKVEISEISLETQAGTLTGYLLRPETASAPVPGTALSARRGSCGPSAPSPPPRVFR